MTIPIRPKKTFAAFCRKHKIAQDSIRWVAVGDKNVKVEIAKSDFSDGGWNLLSVAIVFALRQLGLEADVTIREVSKNIEVVVEK